MNSEKGCLINDDFFGLKITAETKMLENITALERLDPNNCLELERLQGKVIVTNMNAVERFDPKKSALYFYGSKKKTFETNMNDQE